jgi:hypothetical protein
MQTSCWKPSRKKCRLPCRYRRRKNENIRQYFCMKISGKGVIVILIFLVVIPVMADWLISSMLPKSNGQHFAMTKLLSAGYLNNLPFYIGYLILAFTIIFLIRKWKQRSANDEKEKN